MMEQLGQAVNFSKSLRANRPAFIVGTVGSGLGII